MTKQILLAAVILVVAFIGLASQAQRESAALAEQGARPAPPATQTLAASR